MKFLSVPKKGFSLLELLLVISIIGIFFVPLLLTFKTGRTNRALDSSAEQVQNHARSAHIFAREAREKKSWGIRTTSTNSYEIVKYDSSGSSTFQEYVLDQGVSFSGSFEVVFGLATGETTSDVTIGIEGINGQTREVLILKTGVVEALLP